MLKALLFFVAFCFMNQSSLQAEKAEKVGESGKVYKPYHVMTGSGLGFGDEFMAILGALDTYERGKYAGVSVELGTKGFYYDPTIGKNWWENYFEPLHVGSLKNAYLVPGGNGNKMDKDLIRRTEFKMRRQRASYLINKYIRIKPHIKAIVEEAVLNSFGQSKVIGVHYRGTDKKKSVPPASFEKMAELVDSAISKFISDGISEYKIFVASDQQNFIDFMLKRYPQNVIYYTAARRSVDGTALHKSTEQAPYKKGEDALIDCLLLSRTHYLIKTSSSLSLCSAYFNPDIPMIHATVRPWHNPLE